MIVDVQLRTYWWFTCEGCRQTVYAWTLDHLAYERHADCYIAESFNLNIAQKARASGCSDVYSYMTILICDGVKTVFTENPQRRLW